VIDKDRFLVSEEAVVAAGNAALDGCPPPEPKELTTNLAAALMTLYKVSETRDAKDGWVNINVEYESGDFVTQEDLVGFGGWIIGYAKKLAYWGLVEVATGRPREVRITDLGKRFVSGDVAVPDAVVVVGDVVVPSRRKINFFLASVGSTLPEVMDEADVDPDFEDIAVCVLVA